MTPAWNNPSVSVRERELFFEEVITPGNLRRMFWFILACLPVSIGFFISNILSLQEEGMTPWLVFDIGLAGVFIFLNRWIWRKGAPFRHGHTLVLAYYIYTLASMDGYYFSSYARFGENTLYVLGVMMAGVIFRLPPRQFLTLLVVNHLVFVAVALDFKKSPESLTASLIGGLDAVVVAALAAWFLFAKEWDDFQKGRLVARRNEELAEANALLVRSNEEMSELMAIAAHDLRSPLAGIKSWFDLLSIDEAWRQEPYARVLRESGRTCGEMLSLVGRLLEAHSAETQSRAAAVKVDLQLLAEKSVQKFSRIGEEQGICFELKGPKTIANSDPDALAQALDNLLGNAVKYAPPGSTISVVCSENQTNYLLEIHDEGSGVAEGDIDRLFQKFYRGRTRPLHGEPGAGLGLFIVSQLIERLGGSVIYLPRKPKGAIFRIELPKGD